MDHIQKYTSQLRNSLFVILIANSVLLVGLYLAIHTYIFPDSASSDAKLLIASIGGSILISGLLAWIGSKYLVSPIRYIWQAILHTAPKTSSIPAPDVRNVWFGREFATILTAQVYQIASVVEEVEQIADKAKHDLKSSFVANSLPLPLLVLDKDMSVLFANDSLLNYLHTDYGSVRGLSIYTVMDMMFSDNNTLDSWLSDARKNSVTATRTWERVKLNLPEQKLDLYFDLVAYYNKNNPAGFEVMLVLFDRTHQYSQDEQAMSFVALAAHELRTPLTLLRGYIEAFEEELEGKLNPELTDFMHKMKAAAQQLAAFTTNILNVAKYENNQLTLKLHEEKVGPVLQTAVNNMVLRAQIRGIKVTLQVDENLPTVGVDTVSIDEVVSNLIDNAIKYSGDGKEIQVRAYMTQEGRVEVSVRDFGVGMPETAMANIFDKFYRDFRNKSSIGGTGMGLYLCKAIVSAHGGMIWVQSKEGQGSTFGFTLIPYSELGSADKNSNNSNIVRTAHGWIKNHSLYRE